MAERRSRYAELQTTAGAKTLDQAQRGLLGVSGGAKALPLERCEIVGGGMEAEAAAVANDDTGGARIDFDDEGGGRAGWGHGGC